MLGIAIGGFGILVALGVLIGHALDRNAQADAWRRIAAARRINAERARRLDEVGAGRDGPETRDPPARTPVVRVVGSRPDLPGPAA